MMTPPFARFGGFPFALAAVLAVAGLPSGHAPQQVARSVVPAEADGDVPRRQRRRGEAAVMAAARLVATEPVLTRRGIRARPVPGPVALAAGSGPRLVPTPTRRGSRLRPAAETGTLAALR